MAKVLAARTEETFEFNRYFQSVGISPALSKKLCGALIKDFGNFNSNEDIEQGCRKRFLLNLMKNVTHDFHRESATHLFFSYYSSTSAIRAFHPFKDKAFEGYLLSCGHLAASNSEGQICEWNRFLEGNQSSSRGVVVSATGDAPCSGIINFRVEPKTERAFEILAERLVISMNRLSTTIFESALESLDRRIRSVGLQPVALSVRTISSSEGVQSWRQRTVRTPKSSHAMVISAAHELGVSGFGMATYLFNSHFSEFIAANDAI
jgi:hypothetical protein